MKKVEKIFFNIITVIMAAEIFIFFALLAYGTALGEFDWAIVILAMLLIPPYMILNLVGRLIYEIVFPSDKIYWRIFRWVECAAYLIILILIFADAMHETPFFLSIIPFAMTITEIAVRLVIRYRNKKAIQKSE